MRKITLSFEEFKADVLAELENLRLILEGKDEYRRYVNLVESATRKVTKFDYDVDASAREKFVTRILRNTIYKMFYIEDPKLNNIIEATLANLGYVKVTDFIDKKIEDVDEWVAVGLDITDYPIGDLDEEDVQYPTVTSCIQFAYKLEYFGESDKPQFLYMPGDYEVEYK